MQRLRTEVFMEKEKRPAIKQGAEMKIVLTVSIITSVITSILTMVLLV